MLIPAKMLPLTSLVIPVTEVVGVGVDVGGGVGVGGRVGVGVGIES